MSTGLPQPGPEEPMPVAPELFLRLVDDASPFPPASLTVADAVLRHGEHQASWYAPLVGPLLVPAGRTDELLAAGGAVALDGCGLVATDEAQAARGLAALDGRVEVTHVELPLASGGLRGRLPRDLPLVLEVPRWAGPSSVDDIAEALRRVGRASGATAGVRAKLRTGGTEPAHHPSVEWLAAGLHEAARLGIAVKLTAGLHHPVRRTSPTGAEEHGFLNVLVAAAAAVRGAGRPEVEECLAERDVAALLGALEAVDAAAARATRSLLTSYGCCDVTDPAGSLADLGLVRRGVGATS